MGAELPAALSAAEAARRIRDGILTSEELVQGCLEQIRALEPRVQAWQFLDEEHALAQARALDERKRNGEPLGPLHGVPVGVKDIIDTADMPTENGTVLHKGRTPRDDAGVVTSLRAAGAVILGKTVTTECAYFNPGKTRNPHNPEHTPGGSSSGSAAAVGQSHGAARAGQPDRRLGDPPGGVLRRLRLQADAWADSAPRHPAAFAHARPRRPVRAQHRRHRAAARAAAGLRRARSGYPPACPRGLSKNLQ